MNLGSRLEGLNKVYGTDIIVGEHTARMVEQTFRLRELDRVWVVGRAQAVHIYELVGRAGVPLAAEHDRALWAYAEALEAYRKGRWAEALARFREALTLRPQDGPARALAQRCLAYEGAPPEPWDGVFDQRVK